MKQPINSNRMIVQYMKTAGPLETEANQAPTAEAMPLMFSTHVKAPAQPTITITMEVLAAVSSRSLMISFQLISR